MEHPPLEVFSAQWAKALNNVIQIQCWSDRAGGWTGDVPRSLWSWVLSAGLQCSQWTQPNAASKRKPFPTAEVDECPSNTVVAKFTSHFINQNWNPLSCRLKHGITVKYSIFSMTCKRTLLRRFLWYKVPSHHKTLSMSLCACVKIFLLSLENSSSSPWCLWILNHCTFCFSWSSELSGRGSCWLAFSPSG